MADDAGREFVRRYLTAGAEVLEVASLDSGASSIRAAIEASLPRRYVGVDIVAGPGVDEVVDASRLVEHFGSDAFDIVTATELIEHTRDWRVVVSNLKRIVRPGGRVIITTRSHGYPFHPSPFDYWRYEVSDMHHIFLDMENVIVEADPEYPGVFVTATKPLRFVERPSRDFALYSVIRETRCTNVTNGDVRRVAFSSPRRFASYYLPHRAKKAIWELLPGPLAARLRRGSQG